MHALGTPPALILSQDQTRHHMVEFDSRHMHVSSYTYHTSVGQVQKTDCGHKTSTAVAALVNLSRVSAATARPVRPVRRSSRQNIVYHASHRLSNQMRGLVLWSREISHRSQRVVVYHTIQICQISGLFSFSTSSIAKLRTAGVAKLRRQKIEGGLYHHSMNSSSIESVYRFR